MCANPSSSLSGVLAIHPGDADEPGLTGTRKNPLHVADVCHAAARIQDHTTGAEGFPGQEGQGPETGVCVRSVQTGTDLGVLREYSSHDVSDGSLSINLGSNLIK